MKLKVTVDGKVYDVVVDVDDEPAAALGGVLMSSPSAPPSTAPTHLKAPANEEKSLRAPLAGVVTKVLATEGEKVEAGQTLLVLEAMKMETEITAPAAGTVAEIAVAAGDSVQGGQVLITWE